MGCEWLLCVLSEEVKEKHTRNGPVGSSYGTNGTNANAKNIVKLTKFKKKKVGTKGRQT